MLTKEHIKQRSRNGVTRPVYLKQDEETENLITSCIRIFQNSIGETFHKLEQNLDSASYATKSIWGAMRKLLENYLEAEDSPENTTSQRWELLKTAAQSLRELPGDQFSDFKNSMEKHSNCSYAELTQKIYQDLAKYQVVRSFETPSVESVIHRYNCAQVQGLLLQASWIKIFFDASDKGQTRQLLNKLKFHGLIANPLPTDEVPKLDQIGLEVSGPLSVVANTKKYGINIANFFPHLINMPLWSIEAQIEIKKQERILKASYKDQLISHYSALKSYVPEEFDLFAEKFQSRCDDWNLESGEGFLNLGQESYCFPDYKFIRADGQIVHLEIFHKWHKSQLVDRLNLLKENEQFRLCVAIPTSLTKQDDIANIINKNRYLQKAVIPYTDFPTPAKVSSALRQLS